MAGHISWQSVALALGTFSALIVATYFGLDGALQAIGAAIVAFAIGRDIGASSEPLPPG